MSAGPDPRCHPPTKHDPADGISQASWQQHKHAEQRLQTTRQRIAGQAFRHRGLHRKQSNHGCRDLVSSGCSQLRVRQWQREQREHHGQHQHPSLLRHWQFTITKRSSAGQQIFFLLRQQARPPQLRKVGRPGLETPYLAGVTLKAPLTARPPAPAACCPHPTSHRGPGLVVPSLACPAPANTASPFRSQSLFICIIPLCLSVYATHFALLPHSLAPNLIDNLPIGLVFYRWCF